MYFTDNSSILRIYRIILDGMLKLIDKFKYSTLFCRSDSSAVSYKVDSKLCIRIKSLDPYPTNNLLFDCTYYRWTAWRANRVPAAKNCRAFTASFGCTNCLIKPYNGRHISGLPNHEPWIIPDAMLIRITLFIVDNDFDFALPKNRSISSANLFADLRQSILYQFLNKAPVRIPLRPPIGYLYYCAVRFLSKRLVFSLRYLDGIQGVIFCAVYLR